MKISDIANAKIEEIIIDKKEREYIVDGAKLTFRFTSETKKPFTDSRYPGKKYNGQYGMLTIIDGCNLGDVIDISCKFIEKVRNVIGYEMCCMCKYYSNTRRLHARYQVIFGNEIKEGE